MMKQLLNPDVFFPVLAGAVVIGLWLLVVNY